MKKSTAIIIVVVVILGIIALSLYNRWSTNRNYSICLDQPVNEMNIGGHTGLYMHIHPVLSIEINGRSVAIPANVGLTSSVMRPIHTHEDANIGRLHVEAPCVRDFTLGEFFNVWGRTFNKDCIFEYCTNSTHELKFYVGGAENQDFDEHVLKDLENIKVVYGPRSATE